MSSVYKFLDARRSSFLEDGLLRFTQPGDLNDPYECLGAFPDVTPDQIAGDLLSGVLETVGYKNEDSREDKLRKVTQIKNAMKRISTMREESPWAYRDLAIRLNKERVNKGLGILSLSRRWNSALMWSHYAETYTGFCVGFHRDHSFFKEISDGGQPRRTGLLPVKYETTRPEIPRYRADANGLDIFLTKSVDWEYEQEDRLLALLKDADLISERSPYSVNLFKVPFEAVSEIILGHRASEGLRISVLELGKKLGIPVFKTQVSFRTFDVDRSPLEDGICF